MFIGNVEFEVDEKLVFSELVPEPPPPKITFGADVFNPKLAVGIAGFMKRSLVRRPPYK